MHKVMVIGYPPVDDTEIRHCFHMMWCILNDALLLTPEVEIVPFDCRKYYYPQPSAEPNRAFVTERLAEIPFVDYIIVNDLDVFFTKDMIDALKTRCRRVFSFLELGELCDFSFTFYPFPYRQHPDKCAVVPAPYAGRFYKNVEKEPKSLLLDHSAWLGQSSDMIEARERSPLIYKWLDSLKDEYKIYSLVYGAQQGKLALQLLPDYVTPIMPCPFISYLEKTDRMETFVVTHKGSYNLSVVDMLVRGIRVLSYPEFIPAYNVERFGIPLYLDEKTFVAKVKEPIDKEQWNTQIHKCTSVLALSLALQEQFER